MSVYGTVIENVPAFRSDKKELQRIAEDNNVPVTVVMEYLVMNCLDEEEFKKWVQE